MMFAYAGAQSPAGNGQLWLGFQRTNTVMESERAAPHAQGMEGMTTGNPGTSTHYPTTNVCFAVYENGNFYFERNEDKTYGKPKVKILTGTLTPQEMQQIKAVTEQEFFTKITTPDPPEQPTDAAGMREGEEQTIRVMRNGVLQQFTLVKQRFATTSSNGMDKFATNWEKLEKPLKPFLGWVRDMEKKGQAGKEGTPNGCGFND